MSYMTTPNESPEVNDKIDLRQIRHDIRNAVFTLKSAYRAAADPRYQEECNREIEKALLKLESIAELLRSR